MALQAMYYLLEKASMIADWKTGSHTMTCVGERSSPLLSSRNIIDPTAHTGSRPISFWEFGDFCLYEIFLWGDCLHRCRTELFWLSCPEHALTSHRWRLPMSLYIEAEELTETWNFVSNLNGAHLRETLSWLVCMKWYWLNQFTYTHF